MIQKILFCLMGLAMAAGMGACSKTKIDFVRDNNPNKLVDARSLVRLINLTGVSSELIIDGDTLTNFLDPSNPNAPVTGIFSSDYTKVPTYYFPKKGKWLDGQSFSLPYALIPPTGQVSVYRQHLATSSSDFVAPDSAHVSYAPNQPVDYYFLNPGNPATNGRSVLAYPRAIFPSSISDHILLRVINATSASDPAGMTGSISLTYANGQPVDPLLQGVAPGAASAYADIPFGVYQFRLFNDQQKEFDAVVSGPDFGGLTVIDPATENIAYGYKYAAFQYFKPGGVYTVIASDNFSFLVPDGAAGTPTSINSYRIIQDRDPGVNITYGKFQAVNAMPGTSVVINVDGQPMADFATAKSFSFRDYSEPQVFSAGVHHITVTDQKGAVLVDQPVQLDPNDHAILWAYPDSAGNGALAVEKQNLSTSYAGGGFFGYETGSPYNTVQSLGGFICSIRFLNLCPDLPLVTFTSHDQLINSTLSIQSNLFSFTYTSDPTASQNLATGVPPVKSPDEVFLPYQVPSSMRVYQSSAGKFPTVPGFWVTDIAPVNAPAFVANPQLYPGGAPGPEPGVYTVALVGRHKPGVAAGEEAQLIVIKHSR